MVNPYHVLVRRRNEVAKHYVKMSLQLYQVSQFMNARKFTYIAHLSKASLILQLIIQTFLPQVDYKSYLLDFKSLPLKDEESGNSAEDSGSGGSLIAPSKKEPTETEDTNSSATTLQPPPTVGSENPAPVTPGGHHTMEFFEMCAALITQLAR